MSGIKKWLSSRGLGIIFSMILAIPAVISLLQAGNLRSENRHLASFPDAPATQEAILAYSKLLDLWINDHFGFRDRFIKINNYLRFMLFDQFPTIQVIAGRDNRIFLSAHATTQPAHSAITIPCGYTTTDINKVARQINLLVKSFQTQGIDAKLLIAPSGPMVYSENLPVWLAQRCKLSTPPIQSVLGSSLIDPQVRASLYYPMQEMLALKNTVDVFPKTWFHWAGAGPRAVAGSSVDYFWHIAPDAGKELVANDKKLPSDISHLFPGVLLESQILVVDHAQAFASTIVITPRMPPIKMMELDVPCDVRR